MIETSIPEINVDELMEKIRAEVRRRKEREETVHGPAHQADRASQPAPSPRIDPFNIGTIPEPEPFELKEGGYHINDFLKYHDLHFVMNAYRGILRRRPDSEGLQHFLKNLRLGKMTKAEVLGRLRYAPEGRTAEVKISGLFWNFVVQSSFRIPVLGYFSRLTIGLVNLPVIIRNLNTLEANTFAQLQAQHNHINTLAETAQFKINELIDKHGQVEPILDQKADRDELAELNEKKVGREELMDFYNAKGEAVEFVTVGEPVELRVKAKVVQALETLVLGYGIKDRLGQVMYGTNTWHTKQVIHNPQAGDEYLFTISFPANLGVGSYSVEVALHDRDTHLAANYEWLNLLPVFNVININQTQFVGSNWVEPKIEIESK